jgi:hypothetical protein
MTYTIYYLRPYLPEPECSEVQKAQVIAYSETQVRFIYADCEIVSVTDNDAKVVDQVIRLTTPDTTEQDADAVLDYVEAAEILEWLGPQVPALGSEEWWENIKEVPF